MIRKNLFISLLLAVFGLSSLANAAEIPTWKILWLEISKVDAVLPNGQHYVMNMTNEEFARSRQLASEFKDFISKTTSAVNIEVDFLSITKPVNRLISGTYGYWIDPDSLPEETRANWKDYDSVCAVVGMNAQTKSMGVSWGGVTLCGDDVRYSIVTMEPGYDYLTITHEFLHVLECYYYNLGYNMPDVHGGDLYGYQHWQEFAQDYLTGNIRDPQTGQLIGMKPELWKLHPLAMEPEPKPDPKPDPRPDPKPEKDGGGGGCNTFGLYGLSGLLGVFFIKRKFRK